VVRAVNIWSPGLAELLRTLSKRPLDEATHFLIGLVAPASLTGLCGWLGFRPVSAALLFLILIVLLSLAAFVYFFSPRLFRLDYFQDVVTIVAFLFTSLIVTSLVRQLRARRDELAKVLHTMPVLVWNTSTAGMTDFVNQRFRDYTGLSLDASRGWGG
jgi:PAS domain-containing protein